MVCNEWECEKCCIVHCNECEYEKCCISRALSFLCDSSFSNWCITYSNYLSVTGNNSLVMTISSVAAPEMDDGFVSLVRSPWIFLVIPFTLSSNREECPFKYGSKCLYLRWLFPSLFIKVIRQHFNCLLLKWWIADASTSDTLISGKCAISIKWYTLRCS